MAGNEARGGAGAGEWAGVLVPPAHPLAKITMRASTGTASRAFVEPQAHPGSCRRKVCEEREILVCMGRPLFPSEVGRLYANRDLTQVRSAYTRGFVRIRRCTVAFEAPKHGGRANATGIVGDAGGRNQHGQEEAEWKWCRRVAFSSSARKYVTMSALMRSRSTTGSSCQRRRGGYSALKPDASTPRRSDTACVTGWFPGSADERLNS